MGHSVELAPCQIDYLNLVRGQHPIAPNAIEPIS